MKSRGTVRRLPLLPEGRVFTVRIKDHARHVVFHQLLDEDARDVRFPASRFGQDRYVLLDHRVDVQIDGHLMTRQEADVGAVFLVLRQADHLFDRRGLGAVDRLSGAKRGPRNLEKTPIVTISNHADLGGHPLLHVDGIAVSEELRTVQGEIRLPFDLVDPAKDHAAHLVLNLHELVPFHGLRDGTAERGRADVAVDHADKTVAMVSERPMVGRGFHACIPCAAR